MMKTDNNELARIRSFDEIRGKKAMLEAEIEYEESALSTGMIMFGESLKNSVLRSLKELGRDVVNSMITRFILEIRK